MTKSLYSKIKNTFCIILTAALVFGFSFGGIAPRVSADGVTSRDFAKYGYRYSYENGILTDSQKNLYDTLVILCDRYLTTTIDVPGSFDYENETYYFLDMLPVEGYNSANANDVNELTMLIAIFERENPQYYFIDSSTFFITSDSDGNIQGINLIVYPKFVSGADRAGYTNQIFDKIDSYADQINNYVAGYYSSYKNTTYIKEDMANDLVCEATTYSLGAEYHQSIYSVFVNGSSVCNGYALATSAILNSIGVKVVTPISSNHCWIKTRLDDGSWYATDPTWNDAGSVSMDYYLDKSDANIKADDGGTGAHEMSWPQFYPVAANDYAIPANVSESTDLYADTDASAASVGSDAADAGKSSSEVANSSNSGSNSSSVSSNSSANNSTSGSGSSSNNSANNSASGSSNGGSNGGSNSAGNAQKVADEVVVPEPVEVPDSVDLDTSSENREVSSTPEAKGNTETVPAASANGSSSAAAPSSSSSKPTYANEWRNGKWYNADGSQSYSATLGWYRSSSGWWLMDSSGWYPTSTWQKVDGYFYYFDASGYMAANEWIDGYYINSDGTWTYDAVGSWGSDGSGWWYGDTSGWYVTSSWQKIDGNWYYFNAQGYMVTNSYIDGYWLGADGICR